MKSLLSNPVTGTLVDLDETPGQPALQYSGQTSDTAVVLTIVLPSVNADGSELTDLKSYGVISAPEVETGVNPFEGLSHALDAMAVIGAKIATHPLTPADAGATKSFSVDGLTPLTTYWFVAYASDEAAS